MLRGDRWITRVLTPQPHRKPDGAVEFPGIKVRQAVVAGQSARDGSFAAGGGPINGNDESVGSSGHGRGL